jgi:predicted phosphodiesterase
MSFEIGKYLSEYLQTNKKLKDVSAQKIAEKIISEDDFIKKTYEGRITTLRRAIQRVKNQSPNNAKIKQKKEPKEIKTPYKVVGNSYHFYPVKGEFSLPIEVVDEMFYSYSSSGLDMGSTQLRLKFDIKPWQWHALKHALELYKASHIFSPYSVENTTPEELNTLIGEKLGKYVNTVSHRVKDQYDRQIIKKYKQVIEEQAKKDLYVETIMDNLFEIIPLSTVQPVTLKVEQVGEKEINVVIADIHFGAKNKINEHLPEYSVEALKEAFYTQIIPVINSYNASKVNIFLAGDLIESATGLNHLNSWQGMEEGYYGAKLLFDCYEFLVEAISQIINVNKIIGVSGNHDRSTPNKDHDNDGLFAEVIFRFLKVSFQATGIEVIFDSRLTNVKYDDIVYIMSHGHEKLTDITGSEMVLKYGEQHSYNVCLSGHWHERRIKEDTEILRKIVCPSLFPGNNYSVGLGYSTQAGFLIIHNNGKGKAVFHDYPVCY